MLELRLVLKTIRRGNKKEIYLQGETPLEFEVLEGITKLKCMQMPFQEGARFHCKHAA